MTDAASLLPPVTVSEAAQYDARAAWVSGVMALGDPGNDGHVQDIPEDGSIDQVLAQPTINNPASFFAEASKNLGASVLATTEASVDALLLSNQHALGTVEAVSTVLQWLLVLRKYMIIYKGVDIKTLAELRAWKHQFGDDCAKAVEGYWSFGLEDDQFRPFPPSAAVKAIELKTKLKKNELTLEELEAQWPKINGGLTKVIWQISYFLLMCTFNPHWSKVRQQRAQTNDGTQTSRMDAVTHCFSLFFLLL